MSRNVAGNAYSIIKTFHLFDDGKHVEITSVSGQKRVFPVQRLRKADPMIFKTMQMRGMGEFFKSYHPLLIGTPPDVEWLYFIDSQGDFRNEEVFKAACMGSEIETEKSREWVRND